MANKAIEVVYAKLLEDSVKAEQKHQREYLSTQLNIDLSNIKEQEDTILNQIIEQKNQLLVTEQVNLSNFDKLMNIEKGRVSSTIASSGVEGNLKDRIKATQEIQLGEQEETIKSNFETQLEQIDKQGASVRVKSDSSREEARANFNQNVSNKATDLLQQQLASLQGFNQINKLNLQKAEQDSNIQRLKSDITQSKEIFDVNKRLNQLDLDINKI